MGMVKKVRLYFGELLNLDSHHSNNFLRMINIKTLAFAFALGFVGHFIFAQYKSETAVLPRAKAKPVKGTSYTVQKGDSLQRISKRFYGTNSRWMQISKANKLKSTSIKPGLKLFIPSK